MTSTVPSSFDTTNVKSNPLNWQGASVVTKSVGGNSYKTLSYPKELGQTRYPYYMMFYVNAQTASELVTSGEVQTVNAQSRGVNQSVSNVIASSTLIQNINNKIGSTEQAAAQFFVATKKRINVAMALPMPTAINNSSHAGYEILGSGALGTYMTDIVNEHWGQLGKDVERQIAQDIPNIIGTPFGAATNENFTAIRNKIMGIVRNERKEQIFKGMEPRTFNFRWLLVPQTQEESQTIADIIKFLRYSQYPEISLGNNTGSQSSTASTKTTQGISAATGSGLNMIIPNEIDIEFHYLDSNGSDSEMQNMIKISTCVIESIDVDYTPLGKFIGYDGTDNASAIGLTITFREVEPLIRSMISQGY